MCFAWTSALAASQSREIHAIHSWKAHTGPDCQWQEGIIPSTARFAGTLPLATTPSSTQAQHIQTNDVRQALSSKPCRTSCMAGYMRGFTTHSTTTKHYGLTCHIQQRQHSDNNEFDMKMPSQRAQTPSDVQNQRTARCRKGRGIVPLVFEHGQHSEQRIQIAFEAMKRKHVLSTVRLTGNPAEGRCVAKQRASPFSSVTAQQNGLIRGRRISLPLNKQKVQEYSG
jgi:hypothetical protein